MTTASTIEQDVRVPSPRESAERRTSVDDLTVRAGGDASRHYERDHDLHMRSKEARHSSGDVAGVILVELGLDGYDAHRARLDFGLIPDEEPGVFKYGPHDEVRALTDAIATLTILRDKLAAIEGLS